MNIINTNGGNVLLELFQKLDIEYIFCSPGSEWTPIWENLAQRYAQGDNKLKYINCRDETLAVAAALGYGKASTKLAAVLLHANVGPLHGAMAMRAALWARAPMIICSAYTTHYDEDKGRIIPQSHWLSRLSDIGSPSMLVRPYVKWSNVVTSKETMIDSINRGYNIAQSAPQGPVFLSIPRELIRKTLPDASIPPSVAVLSQSKQSSENLKEVAKLLVESKHPIIITEYAGENPESVVRMTELAELFSIPVYECTGPVYANFPKSHPLHQGYSATEALSRADTVLLIGSITPWYPPSMFPQKNAKIIAFDNDPLNMRLPYYGYQIDHFIVGDIEQSLTELIGIVRSYVQDSQRTTSIYKERLQHYQTEHEKMTNQWNTESLAEKSNKPISPKWFHYIANQVLPNNSISIVETLTHSRYAYQYFTEMRRYFRTSGSGLGNGLGIAIGTKIANKDLPVIFYVGDGSFNYNPTLAGLGLCQEYDISIMVIIFNNGGYEAMKRGYNNESVAVTNNSYLGVNILPRPEYTKIAEAFDVHAEKLIDPNNIAPALERALHSINNGKTALIDCITT